MLALLYAVTTAAVRWSGLVPAVPVGLPLAMALVGLPFALCLMQLAQQERARGAGYQISWLWCLGVAAAILVWWNVYYLWPLIAIALWTMPATRFRIVNLSGVFLVSVALTCGYGVVWNLNYLLERYMPPERYDPLMRAMDLVVYRWIFGPGVNLVGLFPLVSHPVLLRMLDNGYAILVPEVILVAFLHSQLRSERATTEFLYRLFGLYMVGIVIFMLFPVNGQHLFYPEQQDLTRSLPATVTFAEGMMHDYRVAKLGGQLTGYGYFIAVPSLHVLVSIFLQQCLRPYPALFKAFLPINVTVSASTVLLGYHYLFDILAAVGVYGLSVLVAGYPGGAEKRDVSRA